MKRPHSMKRLLVVLSLLAIPLSLPGADPPVDGKPKDDKAVVEKRWFGVGNKARVKRFYAEVDAVVMCCVYKIEIKQVPNGEGAALATHQEAVFHATVIRSYKGGLKTGDKITISFGVEFDYRDPKEMEKKVAELNARDGGMLKFGFLKGKDNTLTCEWPDVPDYEADLEEYLGELKKASGGEKDKK